VAIQRWTERVDVPSRRATSLGLSSSAISSRVSHTERGATSSVLLLHDPGRSTLLCERCESFPRLVADTLSRDHARRVPFRRSVSEAADFADDGFRGTRGCRACGQDIGDRRLDRRVESFLALGQLVDEPDPLRPDRVEATAARKQRTRMGLPDLRDDERRDDRGEDAQPCLGEPESGAALGEDQVGHGAQAHPAAECRPLNARDDGHRADIDRFEHVGHRHRVLLVALDVERHGGAHPGDIGAGAERRSITGEDDDTERAGVFASEAGERGPQLRDQRGIECVVDVRPSERHASDDTIATGALDPEGSHEGHRTDRVHAGGSVLWREERCDGAPKGVSTRTLEGTFPDMGPGNPWSPNWRPDPTGRRLASIRTARRGALLAAILLGGVTAVAAIVAPEADGAPLITPLIITMAAIPALALLGAGLAPAATGSRVDAAVAGVAFAIGAPVAAALSSAIAVFIYFGMNPDVTGLTGEAVGDVIRVGVSAAMRVAPMLAVTAALWVLAIRLLERRITR
jgi:hypothetical protein